MISPDTVENTHSAGDNMNKFMTNDNVDLTLTTSDQCDENISFPSSSSSSTTTPIPTTPTREIPKQAGSPIMRGLQNVLNMFRSSQEPVERGREVSTPDITPRVSNGSVALDSPVVASTPVASRKDDTSKRSSPLKDSIVFTEELSNELQWNNDSTVIFQNERVPPHKLFMQQPLSSSSSDFSSYNNKLDLNTSVEPMDISLDESVMNNKTITLANKNISEVNTDKNAFIEPMDISYNDSVVNRTEINVNNASFSETKLLNESNNNSVFLDCESSLYNDIQNETELLRSFDEYVAFSETKANNPAPVISDPISPQNKHNMLKEYLDNIEKCKEEVKKDVEIEDIKMDHTLDKTIYENKTLENSNTSSSLDVTVKNSEALFNETIKIVTSKSNDVSKPEDANKTLEVQIPHDMEISKSQENILSEITNIDVMQNLDNTINIIHAINITTNEGPVVTEQIKNEDESIKSKETINCTENIAHLYNDDNLNNNVLVENNVIANTGITIVASNEKTITSNIINLDNTENPEQLNNSKQHNSNSKNVNTPVNENRDTLVVISNENVNDKVECTNFISSNIDTKMNNVANELEITNDNEKIHEILHKTIDITEPNLLNTITNDGQTKNETNESESLQTYLDKSIQVIAQIDDKVNKDESNSVSTGINVIATTSGYEENVDLSQTNTKNTETNISSEKDVTNIKRTEITESKLENLQSYLDKSVKLSTEIINDNEQNSIDESNPSLTYENNDEIAIARGDEVNLNETLSKTNTEKINSPEKSITITNDIDTGSEITKSKPGTLQTYLDKTVQLNTSIINEKNTIDEANSTLTGVHDDKIDITSGHEVNLNVTLIQTTAKENEETNILLEKEYTTTNYPKTDTTEIKLENLLDKSIQLSTEIINDSEGNIIDTADSALSGECKVSLNVTTAKEEQTTLVDEAYSSINTPVIKSDLSNKKNIKPTDTIVTKANENTGVTNIDFENLMNPFATKTKIRMSPPNTPSTKTASPINFEEIENPFATKSKIRLSPPPKGGDQLCDAIEKIHTEFIEDIVDSDKENKPLNISIISQKDKQESGIKHNSIINQHIISNSSINKDNNINDIMRIDDKLESQEKVKEVSSSEQSVYVSVSEEDAIIDDEPCLEVLDSEVNPFEEDVFDELEINSENKNDFELEINNEIQQIDDESNEPEEMFIDAAAFEFLMNKNGNGIEDNGKESLFLKFDPLCAGRMTSEGFVAALKKSSLDRVTESEQRNINATQVVDATFEQSFEDVNTTVAQKPTMAVMPAVNNAANVLQVVSSTPNRSTRHSMTFCSPAVALIDRLLSINTPDRRDMTVTHDVTVTHHVAAQNEAEDALRQLTQTLAEKEEHNNMLRCEKRELETRLDALESQIKVLERDNEGKLKKINELSSSLVATTMTNKNMVQVVEKYERTIAWLVAAKEQEKKQNAEERLKLISERDEQNTHLASMEVSFRDLHSKFEKCRQVILTYKANEDEYNKKIAEFEESLTKMQKNYEQLKLHATAKLNNANEQLDLLNRSHETEVLRMKAIIKRKELDISSIEESINQKTKEMEELTAICDELLNNRMN